MIKSKSCRCTRATYAIIADSVTTEQRNNAIVFYFGTTFDDEKRSLNQWNATVYFKSTAFWVSSMKNSETNWKTKTKKIQQ